MDNSEPAELTMKYNMLTERWDIVQGNGKRLGYTELGACQVISSFRAATQSDCIRLMMANPSNWTPKP